ncbi:multicopper oxidase domain-containing protein [Planosporangium flavigriseum]|uniref:Plastocyanin-like domain-containing protein n=1 Tax=Planosporangium flavigriseum TaxID=373681 RepID=A0A8J3LNA5_9ACTN|nr:multicopper oxidase domain-containing protein [Planosporangium flavigriseum]NJC67687.1 multicopper oxidase domain-containing protein [Planosporangium flavigriseum]GIG75837.1 hypothetical protein Pfl04_42410 [Planosporangium flavigriseum]
MNLLPVALRGTAFAAVTTLAFAGPGAVAYAAAPATTPRLATVEAHAAPPAVAFHAGRPVVFPTPPAARPALPAPKLSGTLQSNACVNAVCDLWARAGTTTVASRAIPIWGFSSSADPTVAVTAPGPVLVVNEGDDVTINVHNELAGQNLSLAIPSMTGLVPDTTGVATGAVATYTFTAGRPGTYLYEAGHTPDGGRQAAMGLVGALVVKAADSGGRPSEDGTAGTGYDDEAVMVLTEIDPALNTLADPFTFDMRSYAPKYRLINGKAFPETDPVATDVNRTVLLRYVNAGLLAHPMTTLGLDQSVIAQDTRNTAAPEGAVTLPLAPGKTADALVTMPKDQDGRRFMVFEPGGQLNNNGDKVPATPGGSPQQAFGGMMTYLDTNPIVESGDHVGPIATKVAASPNPASALQDITVTATFTDDANGGSTIDKAEVVIDDLSVAPGEGIPFALPPAPASAVSDVPATIDSKKYLQTLTQGRHMLWVRAHDVAGNWGVVNSTTVNLAVTGAATTGLAVTPNPTSGQRDLAVSATGDDSAVGGTVTDAEYFIDRDPNAPPTNGTGTKLTLAQSGAKVTAETGTIPATTVAALAEGKHTVSVHTLDAQGLWGPMAEVALVVDRTGPTLTKGEILPDLVTGSTTGSPSDAGYLRVNADFTDPVTPPSTGVNTSVAAVEGFIDTAGTNGTGIAFQSLDGTFNAATESTYGLIPLTQFTQLADGPHQIQVHAQDAAGNWGPLVSLPFTLDRNGPVVSALSGILNATGGVDLTANATDAVSAVAAAEWFENADPGLGKGKPVTVTSTGATTAGLSATITGLATGDHTIAVRTRDANGNWGKAVTTTVTVNQAALIFANNFNAGDANAWSQRTGTVRVAASPAFSNSPALTVTGRTAVYVTDTRPTAETNLHAQFGFAAGTYTTKGTVVDLFQARTSAGTSVLTVQYQSTATDISQLRVGVQTSTGWKYSAWSTIPRTAVTVRVDWTSATSGKATLKVEGAVVGTATGNTSAYKIETDALGVVAANGSGAVAGAAAIDNFTSNR